MKIAVLADTHDKLPEHVLLGIRGAGEIWHLGDVIAPSILARIEALGRPMRVVRGNCDVSTIWPFALTFEVEGFRIMLIHAPPRRPPLETDLLLHGHTHVPRNEVIEGVRFLNPGCITRPNRGAPASYAWLELERGEAPKWSLVLV